ncbi:MAG: PaaI family thioesterase [Verrucomicrobiales bacterium]|nr:PaaI family thioesterase [Verrucomicrobiales bacterium]
MQQPLPATRSCFVCGQHNAAGLRLSFETDGRSVRGRWVPQPEHVGFKGTIHGGLSATLLDEVMTWACGVSAGKFCFCAEMTVRYLRPLAPGREVEVCAELVANRRGKLLEARAELRGPDGVLHCAATGKYVPMPPGTQADVLEEFVGDVSMIIRDTPRAESRSAGDARS